MRFWLHLLGYGTALLTAAQAPAGAGGGGVVLWDQHIASQMHEALLSDDRCQRGGPYAIYRQTCVGNELNLTLGDRQHHLTLLDEFALFVHRHKDLNLKKKFRGGSELKLRASLSNIHKQEAEVQVKLEIRF